MKRTPPAARARTFDVVTAVWGADYRQLFLEVCLPNLLVSGNLDALPAGSRYRIFTSPDDAPVLSGSVTVRAAGEHIAVDVIALRELSAAGRSAFTKERTCHAQAIADARESGAALMFVCPDHVVSEGAFAAVVRRHAAGSRAVVCAGIRVERDGFLAALDGHIGVRGVSPRDLVSAALGHLHPSARVQFVDSEPSARQPIGVFWNVPGEGILARCFRLHPVMVDPRDRGVALTGTIDGHYVRRACPVRDDIHVVTDSDELTMFEMSHADAATTAAGARRGLEWRAAATMSRCDSHQQSYWHVPIRLHAGDVGEAWSAVEAHSAGVAGRVAMLWAARRVITFPYLKRLRRHQAVFIHSVRRAARPVSAPLRRSVGLMTHAAAKQAHRLRKRVMRMGRVARRRLHAGSW